MPHYNKNPVILTHCGANVAELCQNFDVGAIMAQEFVL